MCGRYASSRRPEDLVEHFRVDEVVTETLAESYNVAPTDPVYAVLERRGTRQLRSVRWGLVPSWAKDISIGSRLINAKAETVADKPAFRAALASRRCLLPADAFYEWFKDPAGVRKKQPFAIRLRSGDPMAFAGLFEIWRDPAGPADAPLVWTATVITTDANRAVRHLHDRMPVVLPEKHWVPWLETANDDVAGLQAMLVPAPAKLFEAYPVSTQVNSVKHNGPELLEPLTAEDAENALF